MLYIEMIRIKREYEKLLKEEKTEESKDKKAVINEYEFIQYKKTIWIDRY